MAQMLFYPIPSTPISSFHWDSFEGSFEDTLFSDFSEILQDINDEILCDNNKRNLNFDDQLETEASTSREQTSGDTPTDFEDILQKIDEEAGYNKSLFTFNTSIGSISLDLEDKTTHSSPHDDSEIHSKNLHSMTAGVATTNPPKKRKSQGCGRPIFDSEMRSEKLHSMTAGVSTTCNPPKKRKSQGRRRPNSLPCDVVDYLKEWLMSPEHINHPYPSESEKARMVADTGIEMKSLNNWFVNNRIRFWKPRFEAMQKKNEQQNKKRKLTDSKEEAHTATACKNSTKKNTQQKKRKLVDSKEAHAATA